MNGTPEKHSFSSSEEKRGKQGGGGWHQVRWKVKKGWGWGADLHGEYIILLHSSTVTRCFVTRRQRVEMYRWQKVNLQRSSPLNTLLLGESSQKGHSDHSPHHAIMKIRMHRSGNGTPGSDPFSLQLSVYHDLYLAYTVHEECGCGKSYGRW